MSTYECSKGQTSIPLARDPRWHPLTQGVLESPEARARERSGQLLLDALCDAMRLPACTLVVAERPQRHRTSSGRLTSKTYGYYRCDFAAGGVRNATIRIYNLTAIRQQMLGPRVFLETLLHEWVHHYDFAGLKLPRSPHTSGFFDRVRSIAEVMGVPFVLPPKREEAPPRPPARPAPSPRPAPPPPGIVATIRAILAGTEPARAKRR
jgi:hypothetical protein